MLSLNGPSEHKKLSIYLEIEKKGVFFMLKPCREFNPAKPITVLTQHILTWPKAIINI